MADAEIPVPLDLNLDKAKLEADSLTVRILELREAYYERDEVLVDDAEYDRMMHRLEELEHLFPQLQGQDSPTQTVGGRAQTTLFDPVQHAERMLSLDNVFSLEEFQVWAARVEKAFRIILKDPTVKAILVNIFGGIVRCDRVAQGVVDAYKNIGDIKVPIIVRLQGTNAVEAKELIDKSGLKVLSAISLQEAADRVKEVLA